MATVSVEYYRDFMVFAAANQIKITLASRGFILLLCAYILGSSKND